jgi:hypothetical protein
MNSKTFKSKDKREVLVYRDTTDEEGNPCIVLLTWEAGEFKDSWAQEVIEFENTEAAQRFIKDISNEAIEEFLTRHKED